MDNTNWAVIVPMANEEPDFNPFISKLTEVLDQLGSGKVYLIIDQVSKDRTYDLSRELSARDSRYITVFATDSRSVVDAYLRGYKEAFINGHDLIIEMDAGLSHDPLAIPQFLKALEDGNECVFGSRFMPGGSMKGSPWGRIFLSRTCTLAANILLGTKMRDMSSGYQGFQTHIVGGLLEYKLLSKGHFYQTEVRYLLRKKIFVEMPIHYKAPSPGVSGRSIRNSCYVLLHYFVKRIFRGRKVAI